MCPTLDTLDLTPQERDAAREMIRKMAYQRWLDAGQPEGHDVECWTQAEREWIEYDYVPHRTLEPNVESVDAAPASVRDVTNSPHLWGAHR